MMREALPEAANASIASSSVLGLKYRISVMLVPAVSLISFPSDCRLTLAGPRSTQPTRAETIGTVSGAGPSGRLLCAERACVAIVRGKEVVRLGPTKSRHTRASGYPVRRGFPVPSLALRITGSPAFAGD